MKRYFLIFLLLSVISGCTQAIRYSPDEIKGFPPAMQEHIRHGEVALGMTQQQVRFSWDSPAVINILQPSEDGKYREEWVYSRRIGLFKTRLIFTDGKLTEVVTSDPGVIKNR